jgi:hypothetical protein
VRILARDMRLINGFAVFASPFSVVDMSIEID